MKTSNCKITGKKTKNIIDFGRMPIANGFLKKKDFASEYFFNLGVSFSESLSLLQLNEHPKPIQMFNKNYPFYTSSSNHMKYHFKKFANWAKKKFIKKNLSKIVEVGSNDGTFLKNFSKKNFDVLGFEPSKNVSDLANKIGIKSVNSFFNKNNLKNAADFVGKTDIILVQM